MFIVTDYAALKQINIFIRVSNLSYVSDVYFTSDVKVLPSIDTKNKYHDTVSPAKISQYIDASIILPQL